MCVCTCMHTCMHAGARTCMCLCVRLCLCVSLCVCVYVVTVCASLHVCVCMCALDKAPNGAGSWFVAQCYDKTCATLAGSEVGFYYCYCYWCYWVFVSTKYLM